MSAVTVIANHLFGMAENNEAQPDGGYTSFPDIEGGEEGMTDQADIDGQLQNIGDQVEESEIASFPRSTDDEVPNNEVETKSLYDRTCTSANCLVCTTVILLILVMLFFFCIFLLILF